MTVPKWEPKGAKRLTGAHGRIRPAGRFRQARIPRWPSRQACRRGNGLPMMGTASAVGTLGSNMFLLARRQHLHCLHCNTCLMAPKQAKVFKKLHWAVQLPW